MSKSETADQDLQTLSKTTVLNVENQVGFEDLLSTTCKTDKVRKQGCNLRLEEADLDTNATFRTTDGEPTNLYSS